MNDFVLVTGAQRGIGLGFVKYYLASGKNVIATIRNQACGEELNSLKKVYPKCLIITALDISNELSITHFIDEIREKSIRFELVISNAGISFEQPFGQWTLKSFEDHFLINTIGPSILSQALVPFIRTSDSCPGKLVHISSGIASFGLNIEPENGLDAYAASKCALNSVSRRLAEKVKLQNICLVMLNPGWVQTRMGGRAAPTSVQHAVNDMASTIESINMDNTGSFLEADGALIPW